MPKRTEARKESKSKKQQTENERFQAILQAIHSAYSSNIRTEEVDGALDSIHSLSNEDFLKFLRSVNTENPSYTGLTYILIVYDYKPALLEKVTHFEANELSSLDFDLTIQNPNCKFHGRSTFWLACLLAKKNSKLLVKICNLPPERFNQLNFNVSSQNSTSLNYGLTVFSLACSLANEGQPLLLDKICALPAERFNQLNFDATSQNPNNTSYGETVFWSACHLAHKGQSTLLYKICALPEEQFNQLNFAASSKNPTNGNFGITVLWFACFLAIRSEMKLFYKLCGLPQEQFNQLNFNACPQNPNYHNYGITVFLFACWLAHEKNEAGLLERISALPPEEFQQIDFNGAKYSNSNHQYYRLTPLWFACQLAKKGKMDLLDRVATLPEEQLNSLDFNVADKAGNSAIGLIDSSINQHREALLYFSIKKIGSKEALEQQQAYLSQASNYCQMLIIIRLKTFSFDTSEINLQPLLEQISHLSEREQNYCYCLLAYNLPADFRTQRNALFQAVTSETPDLFQVSCVELINSYINHKVDSLEARLYNLATALYYALISGVGDLDPILDITTLYLTIDIKCLYPEQKVAIPPEIMKWVTEMIQDYSIQFDARALHQRMLDRLNISRYVKQNEIMKSELLNEMRVLLQRQQSDNQANDSKESTTENASSSNATTQSKFFSPSK